MLWNINQQTAINIVQSVMIVLAFLMGMLPPVIASLSKDISIAGSTKGMLITVFHAIRSKHKYAWSYIVLILFSTLTDVYRLAAVQLLTTVRVYTSGVDSYDFTRHPGTYSGVQEVHDNDRIMSPFGNGFLDMTRASFRWSDDESSRARAKLHSPIYAFEWEGFFIGVKPYGNQSFAYGEDPEAVMVRLGDDTPYSRHNPQPDHSAGDWDDTVFPVYTFALSSANEVLTRAQRIGPAPPSANVEVFSVSHLMKVNITATGLFGEGTVNSTQAMFSLTTTRGEVNINYTDASKETLADCVKQTTSYLWSDELASRVDVNLTAKNPFSTLVAGTKGTSRTVVRTRYLYDRLRCVALTMTLHFVLDAPERIRQPIARYYQLTTGATRIGNARTDQHNDLNVIKIKSYNCNNTGLCLQQVQQALNAIEPTFPTVYITTFQDVTSFPDWFLACGVSIMVFTIFGLIGRRYIDSYFNVSLAQAMAVSVLPVTMTTKAEEAPFRVIRPLVENDGRRVYLVMDNIKIIGVPIEASIEDIIDDDQKNDNDDENLGPEDGNEETGLKEVRGNEPGIRSRAKVIKKGGQRQ